MKGIEAISGEVIDCGKKISESKKKFTWRLAIDAKPYTIEFVNSTLSGKKVVSITSNSNIPPFIYEEKNLLNIDFEFQHNLMGHLIRITKKKQSLTEFELRIDNCLFSELKNEKYVHQNISKPITSMFQKKQQDPFAEFSSFVAKSASQVKQTNDFGQFDLDSLTNQKPKLKQQTFETKNSPSQQFLSSDQFQTNGVKNFSSTFQQNYASQLASQDCFITNNFTKNNAYTDLLGSSQHERPDVWTGLNQTVQQKNNNMIQKITNISAKQVMNKVRMTAQELKNKFTNESLI